MRTYDTLAELVDALLIARGFSGSDLAALVGDKNAVQVNAVRRGDRGIPPKKVKAWVKHLVTGPDEAEEFRRLLKKDQAQRQSRARPAITELEGRVDALQRIALRLVVQLRELGREPPEDVLKAIDTLGKP